jgi:hypothetical protein
MRADGGPQDEHQGQLLVTSHTRLMEERGLYKYNWRLFVARCAPMTPHLRKWRNWQTHQLEGLACLFLMDSCKSFQMSQ